jgi:hypothetical protein
MLCSSCPLSPGFAGERGRNNAGSVTSIREPASRLSWGDALDLRQPNLGRLRLPASGARQDDALEVVFRSLRLPLLQVRLGEGQVHLAEPLAERVGCLLELDRIVLERAEDQGRLLRFGEIGEIAAQDRTAVDDEDELVLLLEFASLDEKLASPLDPGGAGAIDRRLLQAGDRLRRLAGRFGAGVVAGRVLDGLDGVLEPARRLEVASRGHPFAGQLLDRVDVFLGLPLELRTARIAGDGAQERQRRGVVPLLHVLQGRLVILLQRLGGLHARQRLLEDLVEGVGILVALHFLEDLAAGLGENQRRIRFDLQLVGEMQFAVGVDLQQNEPLIHEVGDPRVAERHGVELLAPEAIRGAEVDEQRQAPLDGLLAGGVVVGAPAEVGPRGREKRPFLRDRSVRPACGDENRRRESEEAPCSWSARHDSPSLSRSSRLDPAVGLSRSRSITRIDHLARGCAFR